jgi:hypothetical protein
MYNWHLITAHNIFVKQFAPQILNYIISFREGVCVQDTHVSISEDGSILIIKSQQSFKF